MHDVWGHSYYPQHSSVSPPTRTIAVTGQGTLYVKPDTVIVTIGIRTEHTSALEALTENAKRANAMIQALQTIGIHHEDIDTSSFSIYPKYTYTNQTVILVGYEVEHMFDITVKDVKNVGAIYETAVVNGANIARQLQFKLANMQPHYQQALAMAIKNAQEKARVLARTLQLPLHDVPVEIKEQSHPFPPPPRPMVLAEGAAPPIQTQEIVITAVVHAAFAY